MEWIFHECVICRHGNDKRKHVLLAITALPHAPLLTPQALVSTLPNLYCNENSRIVLKSNGSAPSKTPYRLSFHRGIPFKLATRHPYIHNSLNILSLRSCFTHSSSQINSVFFISLMTSTHFTSNLLYQHRRSSNSESNTSWNLLLVNNRQLQTQPL